MKDQELYNRLLPAGQAILKIVDDLRSERNASDGPHPNVAGLEMAIEHLATVMGSITLRSAINTNTRDNRFVTGDEVTWQNGPEKSWGIVIKECDDGMVFVGGPGRMRGIKVNPQLIVKHTRHLYNT